MGQSQPTVSSVKLPPAKPLESDKGRRNPEYFAQSNAINKQAREQEQKLKQSGGQSAQALGQQAFHAMKSGNPLGAIKPPKMPKVNKSPLATQTTAPKVTTPGFQSLASQAPDAGPDKPNPLQKITRALGAQSQEAGRQMKAQASSPVPQVPEKPKSGFVKGSADDYGKLGLTSTPKGLQSDTDRKLFTEAWRQKSREVVDGGQVKPEVQSAMVHGTRTDDGETTDRTMELADRLYVNNRDAYDKLPKEVRDYHGAYRTELARTKSKQYNPDAKGFHDRQADAMNKAKEAAAANYAQGAIDDETFGEDTRVPPDYATTKTIRDAKASVTPEQKEQARTQLASADGTIPPSAVGEPVGSKYPPALQAQLAELKQQAEAGNMKPGDYMAARQSLMDQFNSKQNQPDTTKGSEVLPGQAEAEGVKEGLDAVAGNEQIMPQEPEDTSRRDRSRFQAERRRDRSKRYTERLKEERAAKDRRIAEKEAERQAIYEKEAKARNQNRIFEGDLAKGGAAEANQLGRRYKELSDNGLLEDPRFAKELQHIEARKQELMKSNPDAGKHFDTAKASGFSIEDEKKFLGTGIYANNGVKHFIDKTKNMSDAQAQELAGRYGIDPDKLQIARDLQKLKPGDHEAALDLKDRISDTFKGEDGGTYERMVEKFMLTDDPIQRQHLMSPEWKHLRGQDVTAGQKAFANSAGSLAGELSPGKALKALSKAARKMTGNRQK